MKTFLEVSQEQKKQKEDSKITNRNLKEVYSLLNEGENVSIDFGLCKNIQVIETQIDNRQSRQFEFLGLKLVEITNF